MLCVHWCLNRGSTVGSVLGTEHILRMVPFSWNLQDIGCTFPSTDSLLFRSFPPTPGSPLLILGFWHTFQEFLSDRTSKVLGSLYHLCGFQLSQLEALMDNLPYQWMVVQLSFRSSHIPAALLPKQLSKQSLWSAYCSF